MDLQWAIKHTQLVSKLKEDISSIEETVENAHKYLDSRITSTKDDATAQVQSVYDHIDDVKKDIHDKIDGVVADASKMVTASIDKVEGKN